MYQINNLGGSIMTEATIKIKSRDINSPIPLPGEPQHLFIIHTDSNGKEKTIIR